MTTGQFRFTTGRWYNKQRDDGGYAKAPAYREGFTYEGFAYGTDTPEDFTPAGAVLQPSLICSRSAQFLAVDVDYPQNLPGSATGTYLSWSDAISVRGTHFHIGIDMRGVDPADWPRQGRTAWGDIKASGFIPVPGCTHYSGEHYSAAANWEAKLVPATPELVKALHTDREAHALSRIAAAGTGGSHLPDGRSLYASGYAGGAWEYYPDGALAHDDELKDLVYDMHVVYGRGEEEVRATWHRLAGALGTPWTERDFARHWHRVPAMRARQLDDDDALRLEEDFGLRMPEPPLQAALRAQTQAWQEADPARPRPPQPTDWGFEVGGVNYWPVWLGGHAFDAGAPNDADNAAAVLNRAGKLLRYDEEAGSWLLRDTCRWTSLPGTAGPRAVMDHLRHLLPEGCADPLKSPRYEMLDPETDAGEIAALKRHAKNQERFSASMSRGAVAAVMTDAVLSQRGCGGTVRSRDLDAHPEVLWAGGVPWDLRASANGPVQARISRDTPHLMSAACVPDPSVPTPLWDAFCAAIWPEPELRAWALRVLSVGFTGYADAVMPVLLGDGGLGKTFLMNLLTSVLGDYGGVMHSDLLKPDARLHGSFTLKLKGLRLAFVDEAPGRGNASQEHLKKITGGGKMEGNRMRENPVEFVPTHTLCLAANLDRKPPVTEQALARRARLILFKGDAAQVRRAAMALGRSAYSPQWQAEMPGVLAAMMREAALWLEDPDSAHQDRMPVDLRAEADELAAEDDSVLAWLADGEVVPDEYGTKGSVLHEHYLARSRRHGVSTGDQLTETSFGRRLTQLGYPAQHRRDGKYRPLRIVPPGAGDFWGGGQPPSRTVNDQQKLVYFEETDKPGQAPGGVHGLTRHGDGLTAKPVTPENPRSGSFFSGVVTGVTGSTPYSKSKKENTKIGLVRSSPIGEKQGAKPVTRHPQQEKTPLTSENASVTAFGDRLPVTGSPAVRSLEKPGFPENLESAGTESPPVVQNPQTPPEPKTRHPKLTDAERAQRAAARKEKLAAERAAARAAKVAELGGDLVTLPAIVLRDGTVLSVDAATARQFLEPSLAELSVDVEHAGYALGHRNYALRLVQLGNEGFAVVLDPGQPDQAQVITWALARAGMLHAHSAHADLGPLVHAGLADREQVWGKMYDTVHVAKLTDPAMTDSDESALKPLARSVLGEDYALSWRCDEVRRAIFAAGGWLGDLEPDTPVERSGWANVPLRAEFIRYAASDVMDCAAVWRVLTAGVAR